MYAAPTVATYTFTMVKPRVVNYNPSSATSYLTETYSKLWLTGS